MCVVTFTSTHAKTVTKKPSHAPSKAPVKTITSKPSHTPSKSPTKKTPTAKPSKASRTIHPTPTEGTQYPTATFYPTYVEDTLDTDSTDDDETDDSSSGKLSTNIVVLVTILSIVGIAVLSAGGYFVWSLQYTLRPSGTEQRPLMEKIKRRENPI